MASDRGAHFINTVAYACHSQCAGQRKLEKSTTIYTISLISGREWATGLKIRVETWGRGNNIIIELTAFPVVSYTYLGR
jgi:hypothetical protein